MVEEFRKPGDNPDGGEPKVEPGTKAADDKDASTKEGTPELKS